MSEHTLVPTNASKYELAAATPTALVRLISKVQYVGDCWVWTAGCSTSGYPIVTMNKQQVYAHRLSHWIVRGAVPDGWVVDHLCREPRCINPLHLEAVLTRENTRRGHGAGSRSTCPSGHEYNDSNTRRYTNARGYVRRYCIACQNERNAARYN